MIIERWKDASITRVFSLPQYTARSGTEVRYREKEEERERETHVKSAAKPAPTPELFVGVLTETKMRSASIIALSTSVEKNKFLPRLSITISSKPGS